MVTSVIEAGRALVAGERLGALVKVVAGPRLGADAVVDAEHGFVAGELPDSIRDDVLADAAALMAREQSRTLEYGEAKVYIETVAPPPVMLIFGAGHISQPLSRFARDLGFRVIVADARPAWATEERFPDVDRLIVAWPDEVFEEITPDARTYVVVLNHDARFENPIFPVVKDAPVRYVGAMGSRRTHRARLDRLAAAGWSEEELDSIHGPIGLDVGAETPEEMAIAILAEIIQVRYGHGTGMSLRGTDGRIHAQRGDEPGTS
jgi:xanthine dehydrogenase accessory factor